MHKESVPNDILQTYKSKFRFSIGEMALFTVLVMSFVMGLVKIYSADLGFHLKSAEWMLKNKGFIYTDSFSYGSDGHKYYDLQWLFQLLVFYLYKTGQPVLVVVNALLISSSIALTWLRFSKYPTTVSKNIKATVFALIAFCFVLALTFEIRPHVLSWLYLNLLLLALESYKRGKQRAVFFLPLIMLFWVNTHSLSILGLVTIGIYNAGLFFENKKIDTKLLLFSGFALAAFLINPYFFDGLLFPFKQFGLISGGQYKSYITEMESPFTMKPIQALGTHYFLDPIFLVHVFAIVAIICIFRSLLQKKFTDALLLIAYLFVFNLGIKNYGYYLVVTLPLVSLHIIDWLQKRLKAKQEKAAALLQKEKNKAPAIATTPAFNKKIYQRLAITIISFAILISITCINDGYTIFLHSQDRFGFSEDKDQLPVEATDFLIKNNIKGKMLNHFNYGGYLMAHANAKVFIDGRIELMDDDFFNSYYISVTEENGLKNLLDTFNPDIVIFPYGGDGVVWWNYFLAHKNTTGYKPVYFDGLSIIYLKSAAFPQTPELTAQNVLKDLDVNSTKKLDSFIRTPDKPSGITIWVQSIWKKQVLPMDDAKKAMFCFGNGFETAALVYSARCIERSTVQPNDVVYSNLAYYYRQKKMFPEAELCEEKAERIQQSIGK